MTDRILAVAALLTLFAFLATLVGFVPETDLAIVIAVCTAMVGYDFWRTLARRRP